MSQAQTKINKNPEHFLVKLNNLEHGIVKRLFGYLNQFERSSTRCKTNDSQRVVHNLVELAYTHDSMANIVLPYLEEKNDRNSWVEPVAVFDYTMVLGFTGDCRKFTSKQVS